MQKWGDTPTTAPQVPFRSAVAAGVSPHFCMINGLRYLDVERICG
jgi:hypothetical protein